LELVSLIRHSVPNSPKTAPPPLIFDNGFAAAALFNRGDLVQSCRGAAGSTMSGTKTKQENPEAA
jgi:hypothetical protein